MRKIHERYVVYIEQHKCSDGLWEVSKIPYIHFVDRGTSIQGLNKLRKRERDEPRNPNKMPKINTQIRCSQCRETMRHQTSRERN